MPVPQQSGSCTSFAGLLASAFFDGDDVAGALVRGRAGDQAALPELLPIAAAGIDAGVEAVAPWPAEHRAVVLEEGLVTAGVLCPPDALRAGERGLAHDRIGRERDVERRALR
jgi:hypothetical protein